jgi:hypothetical protein
MATATVIKLVTYRGDSPIFPFHLTNSANPGGIDITGYVFVLTVDSLEEPPETSDPSATELFSVSGVLTDAANGKFSFQPTTTDTNQTPGEYYYDISLVNGTEKVTIVKSTFEIKQDIGKT